jgi:N-acyl-D-aspartate/D-glutamate deacylase
MVFGAHIMDESHWRLGADMSRAAGRPLNWNVVQIDSNRPDILESKLHAGDYARANGGTVYALVPSAPMTTILNFVNCFIIDTIPNWQQLVPMSLVERRAALANPALRAALKEGATRKADNGRKTIYWPGVVVAGLEPRDSVWNYRPLGEYAAAMGKEPLDALFDVAVEGNLGVCFSRASESTDDRSWEIRKQLWQDPRCLIGGSDAGAHLDMLDSFAFSTKLLGEGVRRRGLLSLEEAVHRITALPAEKFGLKDRGRISLGAVADLVIFDPGTVDCGAVAMRADLPGGQKRIYADAIGIREVIVGGIVVACSNQPTGRMGGKVLRSGRDTVTVPV